MASMHPMKAWYDQAFMVCCYLAAHLFYIQCPLQEAQQALGTALYQEAAQVGDSASELILCVKIKVATADAEHTLHRECWR